jgi:hypothetical protein
MYRLLDYEAVKSGRILPIFQSYLGVSATKIRTRHLQNATENHCIIAPVRSNEVLP